jgi:hypothetical protein
MPARFVEVTNLADEMRKADALAYMPKLKWNASDWVGNFSNMWPVGDNSTSNDTLLSLGRVITSVTNAPAPKGVARYLLFGALLLLVMRGILVRQMTRRALAEYGHAHSQ